MLTKCKAKRKKKQERKGSNKHWFGVQAVRSESKFSGSSHSRKDTATYSLGDVNSKFREAAGGLTLLLFLSLPFQSYYTKDLAPNDRGARHFTGIRDKLVTNVYTCYHLLWWWTPDQGLMPATSQFPSPRNDTVRKKETHFSRLF